MKIQPLGIRTRLTITYVAIFTVILSGFGIASYTFLKQRLDADLTEKLEERAAGLRGYLDFRDGIVRLNVDPSDPEQEAFVQLSTRYFQLYDAQTGTLLRQSQDLEVMGLEFTPQEVALIMNGAALYDVQTDYGRLRFRNEVVRDPFGRAYLFQVGLSLQDMDTTLNNFFALLLWLIPSGIIFAVVIGFWASARALSPLSDLADAVAAIEVTRLDQRVPVRGAGDELDRVSNAFNDALGRLDGAVGEMRQFTASISHELRTPLSILRGEAEIALMQSKTEDDYRRVLSSQLEEIEKLTRMINQLLTLARAEAGEIRLDLKPLDLAKILRTLAEQMIPVAEAKGVQLRVEDSQAEVTIRADATWIDRIILNLVDNAIKFTPAGGSVTLKASSTPDGAELVVADTGRGIPAESLPRIFERFYQVDSARSSSSGADGVGLGLSLVKWAVNQHGGSIDVQSESGRGTTFRILFPPD